jgi:hypothetical protein
MFPLSLSGYESKQYLYLPENCSDVACVPHTPLDEQNYLPSFGAMDCRGMGVTTSCWMSGGDSTSLPASGSFLSCASQDHGVGDLGGSRIQKLGAFFSRARGKCFNFVGHVHTPLTSDAPAPSHAERTRRAQSGRMFPLPLSGYESKQYLYLPENCTEVACVPHTPLDEQNDLPSFGPMDCRGMGVTPSCRMSGGTRHPCQHREVSCPVSARITDWEISGGSRRQQLGVCFSRARGKFYTFVGHVHPP